MDPEQVTVADAAGTVLSAPGQGVTTAAGDARSQLEQDYEDRLAANAQAVLDPILGPGRAKVSVRADVDLDQRSTTSDRKSTRLNSSHANISYAVFCLKKKK